MSFFLTAYRGLTACSGPILQAYLDLRLKKGKEHPTRISERFGYPGLKRPAGKVLWLHAASVGELNNSLPLLRTLLQARPDWMCLVTTVTVTAAAIFDKEITSLPAGRVMHQFMPVDHPQWVTRFLDHWKPDAVLWLESELWPNVLLDLQKHEIPVILLNARMRPNTVKTWRRFPSVVRAMVSVFESVLVGARDFIPVFKEFGAQNALYLGNLKLTVPPPIVDDAKLETLRGMIGDRLCVGTFSTQPTDEIFFAEHFAKLKKEFPGILGIIVPRHPKRGDEIRQELENNTRLSVAQRSTEETITPETDLYIADTMGEMSLWWSLCPVGVIGGSFFPFGGQNPFECTHFGCIPVYGPHMFNFPELTRILEERNVAIPVASRDDLFPVLKRLLEDKANLHNRQVDARMLAKEFANSIAPIADYITSHIMMP